MPTVMSTPLRNTLLGLLTGAVSLVGMVRLVLGAFGAHTSVLAWSVILVAMLPWVAYAGWRARRGQLGPRAAIGVLALDLAGVGAVGWFTIGPVLALAFSLAAFAVIWVSDWPARRPRGEDRFVRIEELRQDDPEP